MSMKLLATLGVSIALTGISSAALIAPITANTKAFNESGGGGISSLFDDNDNGGSSNFNKPDANDPSTWTASGQEWQNDWQGNNPLTSATNNKVGWVTFDFGSAAQLDQIFIWNISENTGQNRRVNTYNIYYSNSPTVAPASGSSVDFDFSSGGWTQIGSTKSLLQWSNGTGADGTETLGVTAQYIGLEFITYGGGTRVGLNEVAFTAVPEPSALMLLGLGGLLFVRRRR